MTFLVFGFGVALSTFVMIAIAIILGGNAIFNGIGSAVSTTSVFLATYFVTRYFTREKGKYYESLTDEFGITACSYFMLVVVGAASMYFFGEKTMPESIGSLFFTFSFVISVFLAMFFAYILEIQENYENW